MCIRDRPWTKTFNGLLIRLSRPIKNISWLRVALYPDFEGGQWTGNAPADSILNLCVLAPLREAFLNEIPALGPFNCWNLINAFGWLRLRFLACSNCLTQRRRDAKEIFVRGSHLSIQKNSRSFAASATNVSCFYGGGRRATSLAMFL